ncbi:MAG: helix-turn-helix transcriptional regulator [Fimbriimonadaceae bacterium]|nr:helix-turn-helix transcriptional regulator [Fimbriimonadaceae bacterium]
MLPFESLNTSVPLVYRRNLLDMETFRRMLLSREFLAENFAEPMTLAKAAEQAFFSPYHYQRLFTRAFGESPQEFLTRLRLEHAQTLLRGRDLTVSEVCLEVGYSSLGSFSTLFARKMGCPPTEFRRVFSFPGLWELKSIPGCVRAMNGLSRPEAVI